MATKRREYECKYGCGFMRSRKARVLEHEQNCSYHEISRLHEECKELREANTEINKLIEELKNQVNGLMRRRKHEDDNHDIHNFKWTRDFRFDREFFQCVMEKSPNIHSSMDRVVVEFFNRTPVFYKIKKQKDKLEVKGVLGLINRQAVGVDNVFTSIRFVAFYDVIMDTLLDEFFEYHTNVSVENDEPLPPKEREPDEAREERLMKTLNLGHYRSKPNDGKHNKAYRACRDRVISLMHSTMTKKIKTAKTLTL